MNETSVLELIGELCDIHLGPTPRAFWVQPVVSRSTRRKQLKQKAYDALFLFLKNTAVRDEGTESQNTKTAEEILLQSYKMRIQRKFENADRLESLFDQLMRDNGDDTCQYLRFLAALRGSGGTPVPDKLIDGVFNIPQPKEVKRKPGLLPAGPLCYGDARLLDESSQFYMHYPKELFERPFLNMSTRDENAMCTTFDLSPGTGIGNDFLFTNKFLLGDVHEQTTHNSLFGGLMQGRVTDLGTQLSLPDLSSDLRIRIPEVRCQGSSSSSRISEESGLGSGSASMSSSVITINEASGYDDSVWETALTEVRSKHYTWEWIGYLPGPTEKPHLTEAGPLVFDVLVKLRHRVSAILCSESAEGSHLVTVQSSVLVKHILLMLTGIPSSIFPFSQEAQRFNITNGLRVSGISPEMLANFLSEFVDCGSLFARLSDFSRPPVLNSFYTAGLTFQAFTKAIRKFLSYFTAAILKIPEDLPLLRLKFYLLKAMEQIRYVAQLCHCQDKASPSDAPQEFPTGMKLLSYLYDEAQASSSSSHYPLLLSILQTCFAPFVLFVRDWVFHGVHRDFYSEFMIQVDSSCMEYRDETYWSRAYTLMSERHDGQGVPQFLRDSIHDVVTCGKSLNLLRICNRQHFMCNVSESELPTLSITFSYEDLRATEKNCQTYVGRMKQIAQQNTEDRQEILRRTEQQRIELQQMARRVADQEVARLQEIINEKKRKAKSKKQTELIRLKEQMEADLKRRADNREQAKEEDRNLMASQNREEHALAEEELELEQRVREELVAYYTELGKDAMHRERTALWRVRRAQLGNSRLLFLEEDAERWRNELAEHLHAQDVVDSASHDLPSWVDKSSDQGTAIIVSGEVDIVLPSWAQQESSHVASRSDLRDDSVVLPRWAQGDLQTSDTQTTDITDDGDTQTTDITDDGDTQTTDITDDGDTQTTDITDDGDTQTTDITDDGDTQTTDITDDGDTQTTDITDDGDTQTTDITDDEKQLEDDGDNIGEKVEHETGSKFDDAGEKVEHETGSKFDDAGEKVEHETGSKFDDAGENGYSTNEDQILQVGDAAMLVTHTELSAEAQSTNILLESHMLPPISNVERRHVTDESEESTTKSSVRFVPGLSALTESEQAQHTKHIKSVASMYATKESDPDAGIEKPHLKFIKGRLVNAQSTEERQMIPRQSRVQQSRFSSQETEAKVWTIKKPNVFGHVSQLSNVEYILNMPKLKRQIHQHANLESDFKDFSIKPCIRMRKTMSASKESEEPPGSRQARTHIRVFAHHNASSECQRVDENTVAIRRFRAHNVWGHSSDSTIQRLLYGDLESVSQDTTDGPYQRLALQPGLPYQVESYQAEFGELDQEPCMDLMSHISVVDLGRDLVDVVVTSQEEVEAYKYTPLSILLARSIMAPVRAQVVLVNGALINYFTSELKVDGHFEAIRRYLLMADGDFAEILSNILLEKMFKNPKPHEILNPMFLNAALNKAVRSSIHSNDGNAQNLSFALKYMPTVFLPNAPKSLNCLELRYSVTWPLNIILTSVCMSKYYSVFTFLLQIKKVVWTLKDVWHRLKRDAIISKVGNASEFRHLQLHRQEMEHFVKMMQGYITNQVILVSWQEFQTALSQPIDGLDQLHTLHERYVDKVISRCLLDKKAEKVMKIIQDIFCLILKFRSQLVSSSWQRSESRSEVMHPNFGSMVTTYKSFHVYSFFLFKVVNRLSQKGYQPHLQELLLQLNFNGYYTEAAS